MKPSKLIAPLLALVLIFNAPVSRAEMGEIKIAYGPSIGFLPMYVMRDYKLIEKYARSEQLGDLKVDWVMVSGGAMMNDGLLSGSLQIASGGITPLIVAWAKTAGSPQEIKGVSVISSSPMLLLTRNPAVRKIENFTNKDKIAMPAAKLAPQSIVLQMAAEKAFGPGHHDQLDKLTVSMSHPDATASLLGGVSEVNSHFSTPPFTYQELADPSIHVVLNSDEVLGGPGVLAVMWATTDFYMKNPKVYSAIIKALDEAMSIISRDKAAAAQSYLKLYNSKESVQEIVAMLNKPDLLFSTTPKGIQKYSDFMYRTGTIKVKPASWKDMFLPNNDKLPGN
ncbi:MAG: ABC transporter substrate-binding protein [Betaproteobacteria bacterium]|nr:ABC transporter substrate-binding protein [Betaproteobacteria bacterium]